MAVSAIEAVNSPVLSFWSIGPPSLLEQISNHSGFQLIELDRSQLIVSRSWVCPEWPTSCAFPSAFSFRLGLQPKSTLPCHHEAQLECCPQAACGNSDDSPQGLPCVP